MSWRRGRFKDRDVWVAVDSAGAPLVDGGRVPIRYSEREGAKVYRAGASRVELAQESPARELPEGISADDAPARKPSGRGKGFGSAGSRSARQAQAAKVEASKLLEGLPPDTVVVFTDGGCRGNPGPAGSGVVVRLPGGGGAEACRSLGPATNNVAELTAVALALDVLDDLDVAADAPVALLTDSDYTSGVLTRGWKAKANRALILDLRNRLEQRPGLTIHWVAGHVGIAGNERADELANQGVDGETWTRAS